MSPAGPSPEPSPGPAPSNRLWLTGFCLARALFSMEATTYAAAIGLLTAEWGLSASQAGAISSAHHLGFLVSLFGVGFMADRFGARRTYLLTSLAAAGSALLFAGMARDFLSAFLLYGLLGLCSGGSYTPALAILAEHYPTHTRGRAIGYYIAASSGGYAVSLMVSSLMIPLGGWKAAFWATCLGPGAGMLLGGWMLRGVTNVIPERPEPGSGPAWPRALLANRPAVLMILAYVFHSWELLGIWAWIPYFLATAFGGQGDSAFAASIGAAFTALGYLIGVMGPITGGSLSDRWGRATVILVMALLGALATMSLGWLVASPFWLVVAVALFAQFMAIGDSPVLSTALTEAVPSRMLGAAYAVRSVLGFGAGALSAWVFGLVLDWGRSDAGTLPTTAWGAAFVVLGAVGLLAAGAMVWLKYGERPLAGIRTPTAE